MSGCLLDANYIGCAFYGDQEACNNLYEGRPPVFRDEPRSYPTQAAAQAGAAAGRKFSANFNATRISTSKPRRRKGVITLRRVKVLGGFFGNGTPPAELQMFARGGWQGLAQVKLDPKRRRMSVKGVAIARFIDSRAGEACLRFSGKAKRAKGPGRRATMRGRFKIIGSTAGMTASGRYTRSDAGIVANYPISGRGRLRTGGKPKALPKACMRVKRAFGNP